MCVDLKWFSISGLGGEKSGDHGADDGAVSSPPRSRKSPLATVANLMDRLGELMACDGVVLGSPWCG